MWTFIFIFECFQLFKNFEGFFKYLSFQLDLIVGAECELVNVAHGSELFKFVPATATQAFIYLRLYLYL